jgi:hypothetical protein
MPLTQLPTRRPLAERDDVVIDLTATPYSLQAAGLDEGALDSLVTWLSALEV